MQTSRSLHVVRTALFAAAVLAGSNLAWATQPVASNGNASTAEDTPVTIDMRNFATNPDGTGLFQSVVTVNPVHGSAVQDPVDHVRIIYTPAANYNGPDSFQYVVQDNELEVSNPAVISLTVTPVNDAPAITSPAAATPNTPNEGANVQLSVAASDVDADPLTYTWSKTVGSGAITFLPSANAQNPTFVAPSVTADELYTLVVTVSDGQGGQTTSSVNVTVKNINQPPVANPGGPYTVLEGTSIQLNGSASSDSDGTIAGYSWTGPNITAGANTATPTFTAPFVNSQTNFTVTLVVTDNNGTASAPVSTLVTVTNGAAPTVNAGDDATAIETSSTTLSGLIGDPDAQLPITYRWQQVTSTGTPCVIINATGTVSSVPATVLAQFVSPNLNANTVVTFRLTATDAGGNFSSDDVIFTIQDVSGAAAGAVPLVSGVKTFPSPFSPSHGGATVRYTLRSASDVRVIISDIFGREVRELHADAGQAGGTAGDNDLHWDGKNADGNDVGNGAYTVQVRARDLNGAEGKFTDRVGVRK